MWFFRRFEKARFPRENKKNNRAILISPGGQFDRR
jgi:hypothetical protein